MNIRPPPTDDERESPPAEKGSPGGSPRKASLPSSVALLCLSGCRASPAAGALGGTWGDVPLPPAATSLRERPIPRFPRCFPFCSAILPFGRLHSLTMEFGFLSFVLRVICESLWGKHGAGNVPDHHHETRNIAPAKSSFVGVINTSFTRAAIYRVQVYIMVVVIVIVILHRPLCPYEPVRQAICLFFNSHPYNLT